jgi:lipid-binding SYLF domain-containing protein
MGVVITVLILGVAPVGADSFSDTIARFKGSEQVDPFFHDSYGYAVFPTVGKGGIGVGGAYGKGLVYKGDQMVGKTSLTKLSIGFQLGGQAFSQIVFFQDKRAFDEFTSGSFEFDATASAVAITVGAQAQAGTAGASAGSSTHEGPRSQAEIGYYKGMAVFVIAKGGLMLEAAIGGQKFSFDPF